MELKVAKRLTRPVLQPNRRKSAEAVLFLIEEAERRGMYVTKYDLLKSIFVADTSHLNNYGRPVTFDNYYAMKDGPVPSEVYKMLGDDYEHAGEFGNEWPLWQKEPSPKDGARVMKYHRPRRSANLRTLSETDTSALKEALSLIKAQSFSDTRDMTHQHPAYLEAWMEDGDKTSYLMSYELLMECRDVAAVQDVVHASHYA